MHNSAPLPVSVPAANVTNMIQLLNSVSTLTAPTWSPPSLSPLSGSPVSQGTMLPHAALLSLASAKTASSWMLDKATLELYLNQHANHLSGILDEGHKTELMRGGTGTTVHIVLHLLRHMEPQGWVSKNVAHPAKYLTTSIKNLRAALCSNPLVGLMLNAIWETRPDIAAWVDGRTVHYLADHVHSEEVALQALRCLFDALPLGWSLTMPNQRGTVLSTIKHIFSIKHHLDQIGSLQQMQQAAVPSLATLAQLA